MSPRRSASSPPTGPASSAARNSTWTAAMALDEVAVAPGEVAVAPDEATGAPDEVAMGPDEVRLGFPRGGGVLVTGAASGIGKATAISAAAVGLRVAAWDLNRHGAEATAAEIRDRGGDALAVGARVTHGGQGRPGAGGARPERSQPGRGTLPGQQRRAVQRR